MAYLSYDKLWRSEFYNNISATDRVQDINRNQVKFKVNDSYKKVDKLTTKFEAVNNEHVTNKRFSVTKLSEVEDDLSYIEDYFNEYELRDGKQSKKVLIGNSVKKTIQLFCDKGLFEKYDNADEVLEDYLLVERRKFDLEPKLTQKCKLLHSFSVYPTLFKITI